MTKLFPSLALGAALSTLSLVASADPSNNTTPYVAFGPQCAPGSRVGCSCGNGAAGTATCSPSGATFSACVCANVNVNVNVPVPIIPVIGVPDVRVPRARVRRRPSRPIPGLALLLGGACTLGTGAFNVAFGVDRIRDYGKDPFGIVSVSLGGTAMLVGLPLTIVGIVRYAREPKEGVEEKTDTTTTGIRFAPTANGFAVHF